MKKIITISALLLAAFAPQAMAQEQTQPTQQTARPAFDNELLPWETPRDTTCHEVLLEPRWAISVWLFITILRITATTSSSS